LLFRFHWLENKRKNKSETNDQCIKPLAFVFIDFDHWYVSLKSLYHIEYDIRILLDNVAEKYLINEIYIFGDFSRLENKLSDLAVLTENIYDVGEKKSDKNVIILDKLYRCGIQYKGTNTTVIAILGNGQFTLAERFLKEDFGLVAGVYGIRGAISASIKETADWVHELPNAEYIDMLFPLIVDNCDYVFVNKVIATYKTMVEAVSRINNVSPVLIETAINKMLELGYLYQKRSVFN
jgi:hypothetical protein